MAGKIEITHPSNNSILNMLWDESKQPQQTMRIEVTGPSGSISTLPNVSTVPSGAILNENEEKEEKQQIKADKKTEPPTLKESAAFSTLRMFHEMGLGGDSEDIFINSSPNKQTESQIQIQTEIESKQQPITIKGGGGGNNKSGKKNKSIKRKKIAAYDMDMEMEMDMDMDMDSYINTVNGAFPETTPRKEHDVKDMDRNQEITPSDLQQFESMLENTESLINDMIDVCNENGYGLDCPLQGQGQGNDLDSSLSLNSNIKRYMAYAQQQLCQYNFNLSSNAIVDLMGVKHTMPFLMNRELYKLYNNPSDCHISSQGYVLYANKRLTPHYYFNVIDYRVRRRIDLTIAKIIRDYLRKGHFNMFEFMYPSSQSLKGITPILINHFEEQCKIFYKPPAAKELPETERERESERERYCVIVFPNHKWHIKPGIWSRSVTYFDNVIRGTMFQFIEKCCQINGYGIVLLNPNERYIESEVFPTKSKYDAALDSNEMDWQKQTETLTIPRNESSFAHVIEMYKHFILPQVINNWKCKLLFLSHCDGGNDIINLLETQQDSHKHIIGIAMLDFYNWSLQEFTKKTKQIIEQKAAIYMSLYGSNESAYGLEPSAAKSPVTIFRTANKEKRYSPCYNTESVIRFFKSKIELHKQK